MGGEAPPNQLIGFPGGGGRLDPDFVWFSEQLFNGLDGCQGPSWMESEQLGQLVHRVRKNFEGLLTLAYGEQEPKQPRLHPRHRCRCCGLRLTGL